jgi:ribosomal-protein-alanine N-acetyltransferase
MVLARAVADEAEVLTLAVAPPARRQGMAAALLDAVCDEAARRGAHVLHLEVSTANAAARALYARAGFHVSGNRRAYYADGTDALVMSRALAPPG